MSSEMAEAIRQLIYEKGISEELVLKTVEESLMAAYKKRFGTSENAVVRFKDDYEGVEILARKTIVEELDDPVLEIELSEAKQWSDEAEVGDILELPIDPREFDLQEVMLAKQTTRQNLREISRDTLYAEYHSKVGEIIIGYYQRERNGNIYVDLGRVEGVLPRKYQSPRETYHPNDRIKAYIVEVNKTKTGPQIVLSRSHAEFVKKILELEVPEIYDGTVDVFKIVREPGYRTKISVYSKREDVDPVGACVGLKGIRIQSIIRELEGEKIDVLKYEIDPKRFIRNALSPAEVLDVHVLDEGRRLALAVVAEGQLSVAIGKQGLNVRLANRLCDWNIDVKTEEQFQQMDLTSGAKEAVSALFGEIEEEEISRLSELPDAPEAAVAALAAAGIEFIEDFLAMDEAKLASIEGLPEDELATLRALIDENVEIVTDDTAATGEEAAREEEYECPDCGARITTEMTKCPSCGVELSFEYEDDQEA
ncbi:MAG: transcription termination/antitermination protein NusA [Spirochaetales bacterium]|nr:transcription termination/antitermination protein NusA [Spirochaetales bacterium]